MLKRIANANEEIIEILLSKNKAVNVLLILLAKLSVVLQA
jgi:hypothetical protein